jgi:hypothetical protein
MDTVLTSETAGGDDATVQVLRWRFQQLSAAGFGVGEASTLAAHRGVDLHTALDLVQRGCPPELALQILL